MLSALIHIISLSSMTMQPFLYDQNFSVQALNQAEELYASTFYNEAAASYQKILETVQQASAVTPQETLLQILCRLGQAHFFREDYTYATKVLEQLTQEKHSLPPHLKRLKEQSLYILAIAYRHLKRHDQAIACLQPCLNASSQLNDEMQFESGLNYFLSGHFHPAKQHFQALQKKSTDQQQLYYLAQLYLSRIAIIEGDYLKARAYLDNIPQEVSADNFLHFELTYLQGKIAFHLRDYIQAANYFELSLPKRNHSNAEWYKETLYLLGWCHLKISEISIKSLAEKDSKNHFESAEHCFNTLLETAPQEDFYRYLQAEIACLLTEHQKNSTFIMFTEQLLKKHLEVDPYGPFSDSYSHLLAIFYLRQGNLESAEEAFVHLMEGYPDSNYVDSALFWSADCAEKLKKDPEIAKNRRKKLFESYPESPFAASAFFHYYSYCDYLQGDKATIKHLQAFKEQFPKSPLSISADYLIGLDYKRDRKTPEGRWIRKRNLIEAIDTFQKAQEKFKRLHEEGHIPKDEIAYYTMIYYRAFLERALANQAIAEESQGTKRQIYLQYAEELFTNINKELFNDKHPLTRYLIIKEPFPKIHEESLYAQTQNYMKINDSKSATKIIEKALCKYSLLNITKGYYLSRFLYEKGILAMQCRNYELALKAFNQAGECSELLSVDQKLNLWIQQALCHKALSQFDKAMIILSKVINDDAVSSLRLEAMFLRAELYELQGRHELARKQLEAVTKKGGKWAQQAKIKLDADYGYQ